MSSTGRSSHPRRCCAETIRIARESAGMSGMPSGIFGKDEPIELKCTEKYGMLKKRAGEKAFRGDSLGDCSREKPPYRKTLRWLECRT